MTIDRAAPAPARTMLQPGARLGPYEIVAPIGAGGMGEVFRARDTRLDRTVAIKVLPAGFAQHADLKARFEREAKTISALNHPHICSLFDVGSENGIEFLVMEYLEGESLADRLQRGPLPMEQVLRYGIQIAEGLDRAHRQGIVHRDLKPGNIMITKSGAKLLDFGLAKTTATSPAVFSGTAFGGATEMKPLTAEGTIIGTFQYMAPEQLEGAEADARTDIFAFGTVLYEMATGRRAFEGKTKTSLIAAIVDREPAPMSAVQSVTPPAFERLVKVCMAKDPDDRWQTAHDVLLQLRWIAEAGSQAGVPAPVSARRKHREWATWLIVLALLVSTAAFAYLWWRDSAAARRVELSFQAPTGTEFSFHVSQPMISPDGTRIVFSARDAERRFSLWLRRLDNGAVQRLSGTDDGIFPFWSPDSRFIGFFAEGKLRKMDAAGGPPQAIADVGTARGGSWSNEGMIVYAPSGSGALFKVPAAGGTPTAVTTIAKGESSHRFPWFLPDGRHFLYVAQTSIESGHLLVGSIDSNIRKKIAEVNSTVAFAPPGYILFVRTGVLLAQRFDASRMELRGEPAVIAENIRHTTRLGNAVFSVSPSGLLVYQTGDARTNSRLTKVDRTGRQMAFIGETADYLRPSLSHDGRRVATELVDAKGTTDIWVHDLVRQNAMRVTFGADRETHATWSPDDRWIAYVAETTSGGPREIRRSPSDGAGDPETLLKTPGESVGITDWSADGRYILYHAATAPATGLDVSYYSLADRKAYALIRSPFDDGGARLSRDGRWLAYTSSDSARPEIFVQTFPQPTRKWKISTAGGNQARWRADGKELYYVGLDSHLMAVEIRTGDSFEAGVPKPLFALQLKLGGGWPYDVTPDGQQFVVNQAVAEQESAPVTVVVNWTSTLTR